MKTARRYSLCELFVFLGVICFLFSLSFSFLFKAQNKAMDAQAHADVLELKKVAVVAQIQSGKELPQITGRSCTACACSQGFTEACNQLQEQAFGSLSDHAEGIVTIVPSILRDPWGMPYLIQERFKKNETCVAKIYSAGKDNDIETEGDNVESEIEGGEC